MEVKHHRQYRSRDLAEQSNRVDLLLQGEINEEVVRALGEILTEELSEAFPDGILVERICKISQALHHKRSDGSLPIHVACHNSNCLKSKRIFSLLIEPAPETLQTKNKVGLLPLHKAVCVCGEQQLDVVKMLIDLNMSSLTSKTNDGHTPLHLALSTPKTICAELIQHMLVLNGKIAAIPDSFGHLALHKLVSRSKVEVDLVELLLEANPSAAGNKDYRGYVHLSTLMLFYFYDISLSLLPLHWVVSKRDPNLEVLFLLAERYPEGLLESDQDGCTPYVK